MTPVKILKEKPSFKNYLVTLLKTLAQTLQLENLKGNVFLLLLDLSCCKTSYGLSSWDIKIKINDSNASEGIHLKAKSSLLNFIITNLENTTFPRIKSNTRTLCIAIRERNSEISST